MVLGLFQSPEARSSRPGAGFPGRFPGFRAQALLRLVREHPKAISCVLKRYIRVNSVRLTQRFGARIR